MKREVSTIPILFINVGNPVGVGLVESLSRPGANVTGFSDMHADLSGKYVQFASELGDPQGAVNYLWYTEWADGQTDFRLPSGQPSRLVSYFDHAGLVTSPRRMMSWLR